MPEEQVYLDENGNPIGPTYLDENGNPISTEPTQGPAIRFAKGLGESSVGLAEGLARMMASISNPWEMNKLVSEMTYPWLYGPEMTGGEKATLATEMVTGIPISSIKEKVGQGDIAGAAGLAIPPLSVAALPFFRGGLRRAPRVEVLPPEAPAIRGLLPERTGPDYIGGPSGNVLGQVAAPDVPPEIAAQISGEAFPREAPTPVGVNLAELQEAERLRRLYYGPGEQAGLGSLQVTDRPSVNMPPVAGETSLGFEPVTRADLPYPLNVVPEAVRPRAVQAGIAQATPETIREPAAPPYESKVVRLEGALPEEKPIEPPKIPTRTEAFSGVGTARPGEPQLPSARPRIKSGTAEAKEVIDNIKKSPEPAVANLAKQPAVMSEFKKRMRGTKFYQKFSKLRQLGRFEVWSAIETELNRLGPAGEAIVRMLRLASKRKHELATKWETGFSDVLTPLSKKEYDEFWQLADTGGKSNNPKIQRALDYAKENTKEVFDYVTKLGIEDPETGQIVKPLEPGYTPRIYEEGFWEDTDRVAAAFKERFPEMPDEVAQQIAIGKGEGLVDQLMRTIKDSKGQPIGRHTAETIIRMGKMRAEKKIPSQYRRKINLPGYRTDPLVWSEHSATWAEKVARSEVLGIKDIADPNSPISKLVEMTDNPDYAKKLLNVALSRAEYGPNAAAFQKWNRAANGFAARAHLSMFFISNIANTITIPLRTNLRTFAAAIGNTIMHPGVAREFASKSGALYGVTRNLIEESYKRRAIYDPLRYYGMTASENMNRIISAGTGKYYAEQLFGKLKKGNIRPHELEQLHDLTMTDPMELAKQTKLTDAQLTNVGFTAAEFTQGLGEARKVPAGWNNPDPVRQLPLIFQRYAFQQTKVIKDALFSPQLPRATRLRNLAYLVTLSQAIGYPISMIKAGIRGGVRGVGQEVAGTGTFGEGFDFELEHRKDPTKRMVNALLGDEAAENEMITSVVDNMVNAWALGLFADLLYKSTGDARDFFFDVAGPAAGPIADLAFKAAKGGLPGGSMEPFMRSATRLMPFVGPGLQRAFFPTEFQK